jgi:hypothetical protein
LTCSFKSLITSFKYKCTSTSTWSLRNRPCEFFYRHHLVWR